jgi:hypothetical protein
MPTFLRRLGLWALVCSVSAAPSFMIARREGYDYRAMIVGVVLFTLIYSAATSTKQFERLHRRPFVRRTLYIGFGARMLLSLSFPLLPFLMIADLFPGLLSLTMVEKLGISDKSFLGTFITTCIQGAFLNVIVTVLMLLVYAAQRAFLKPPPEQAQRGFEVVLTPGAGS